MLLETRRAEILDAISEVADFHLPAICVVPDRIPELIDDFSPLLRLNAFKSLDTELQANLRENAWHQTSSKV